RDDFGVVEQLLKTRYQVASGIFATGRQLDGINRGSCLRDTLDGVQVCENSRIVHGAGRSQRALDFECLAQQRDFVARSNLHKLCDVRSYEGFISANVLNSSPLGQ